MTAEFRAAIGAFPTGVTVVTTPDPYGMTVNAFCSVSLDPLLLLVSLRADCRGLALVEDASAFTVNVLSASQQALSQWFASRERPSDGSMFDGIAVRTGATGCPVLIGAAASFDCRVQDVHPAGDHALVIGAVVEIATAPDADPLVFAGGRYATVGDEPRALLRTA